MRTKRLDRAAPPRIMPRMTLLLVLLTWLGMAAVLIAGILMAVGGKIWLLILGVIGFTVLFAKYGCLEGQ